MEPVASLQCGQDKAASPRARAGVRLLQLLSGAERLDACSPFSPCYQLDPPDGHVSVIKTKGNDTVMFPPSRGARGLRKQVMTPAIALPWGASPTWRWCWDFPHCSCVEARLWLLRLLGKPQAHGILSHRHTRTHLHAHICTYTHWPIHTHTHTLSLSLSLCQFCISRIPTHVYIHSLACIHTRIHTHIPPQFCIPRILAHVCTYTHWCIHTDTHTHTHTHTFLPSSASLGSLHARAARLLFPASLPSFSYFHS